MKSAALKKKEQPGDDDAAETTIDSGEIIGMTQEDEEQAGQHQLADADGERAEKSIVPGRTPGQHQIENR